MSRRGEGGEEGTSFLKKIREDKISVIEYNEIHNTRLSRVKFYNKFLKKIIFTFETNSNKKK